jgi:hypothetical protein
MLGHPAFRAKIREWLKVLRKANCLVLMATQSLSDAANSGILDVIVESTATKIFLPNVYARDEDTAALYRRMGLNARQIEILATAIPKRQYYYVSENGRRLYDLALGPMALAFVGASDKESVATIKSLEAKFGDEWVHEWLAGRGPESQRLPGGRMSIADTLKGLIFKKPARAERRAIRAARSPAGRRPPRARPRTPTWPPAAPGTITWAASSPSARPGR